MGSCFAPFSGADSADIFHALGEESFAAFRGGLVVTGNSFRLFDKCFGDFS